MYDTNTTGLTVGGQPLDSLQLGTGSEVLETGSRTEVAAVTQRLVEQAQRSLLLHTECLSGGNRICPGKCQGDSLGCAASQLQR